MIGTIYVDFAAMEREDKERRWRAAFGKEGACVKCSGLGSILYNDCETADKAERTTTACYHCLGTGRGEHERGRP